MQILVFSVFSRCFGRFGGFGVLSFWVLPFSVFGFLGALELTEVFWGFVSFGF